MAEMSLGTNKNNPGDVNLKGWMDGRSNFVFHKGDRKAYLKAEHVGKSEKLAFQIGAEGYQFLFLTK
jgi:hypothetical protein